jgi:ABC-type hemin transport system substrate-binding protein
MESRFISELRWNSQIIRIRAARANATIMPASLLPSKVKYSQVANQLPSGSILILTPPLVLSKQRSTPAKVAVFLRSNGHHVTTLPFSL